MKKNIQLSLCLLFALLFSSPAFAIMEPTAEQIKAEQKYQRKLQKIKQKQEIKCIKHPESCTATPIQQTTLTLGVAQTHIKIGTSQDVVASTLGSPNIATVDSDGKDTWIYDKVSSVTSYNNSGFGIGAGGMGGGYGDGAIGGGVLGVSYAKNKGNYQTAQKTLTIVIKFTDKKVSSFQYHMSNF